MYTGITQGLYPVTTQSKGSHHISFQVMLSEDLVQSVYLNKETPNGNDNGACYTQLCEEEENILKKISKNYKKTLQEGVR